MYVALLPAGCRRNCALSLLKGHKDRLGIANEHPLLPSVGFRAQCGDRAVSQFLPGVEALGNRQLAQLCSDALAAARLLSPSPLHLQLGYLQG